MKFNPKVSIVIPVFNGSNFLREAIESALDQTYENLEVIVVNDGSTDDGKTEEIALSFGARIKYYRKENGGVSTALNLAIEKMTGEFLSWLSHDDLYYPDKISQQIEFLAEVDNPYRYVAYSDYELYNVDLESTTKISLRNDDPEGFRCRVFLDSDLHGCTMLIPRNAFEECGLFNESLKATQDYDMWFRLGGKFKFVRVPRNLVTGRIHEGQLGVRIPWRVSENERLRTEWLSQLKSSEITAYMQQSEALSYALMSGKFAQKGYFDLAGKCAVRSCRLLSKAQKSEIPAAIGHILRGFIRGGALASYRSLKAFRS